MEKGYFEGDYWKELGFWPLFPIIFPNFHCPLEGESAGEGRSCGSCNLQVALWGSLMNALEEGESCEGLPEWELKLLPQAKEIFEGNERYEEIPPRPSHEAYDVMVDFVSDMKDGRVRSQLESSLHGKGAFRRFKDTLREYPEVEKQWFAFKADCDKEEVKEWLESIGIELVEARKSNELKITIDVLKIEKRCDGEIGL